MPCASAVWDDLRGKPVCVSQGSSFTKPLLNDYGAKTHGYKSSAESLQALRGQPTSIQRLLRYSAIRRGAVLCELRLIGVIKGRAVGACL